MSPAARSSELARFDLEKSAGGRKVLAGIDEAGRGCWAGPVVAAAVILPPGWSADRLDDSKRLTARVRESLLPQIFSAAVDWSACAVSATTIDSINILQATLLAMSRAVRRLDPAPDLALVDGRQLPPLDCSAEAIIGGDRKSAAVAAASIIAKVLRDRVMRAWDRRHPGYGFSSHKGYGSASHREALHRLGPSPLHRMSWRPVAELRQGSFWHDPR